jgi:hypothetical protein
MVAKKLASTDADKILNSHINEVQALLPADF